MCLPSTHLVWVSHFFVIKGLEKLGMKVRVLDSLEILELFYTFYNSDQIKSQPLRAETLKPIFEGNYAV